MDLWFRIRWHGTHGPLVDALAHAGIVLDGNDIAVDLDHATSPNHRHQQYFLSDMVEHPQTR